MNTSWGYHLRVDASGLNAEKIRDKEVCENFLREACKFIGMTPYGDPIVVRFGKDPKVSGFSLVQLIEESNITAHLCEIDNTGYFDVFSCLPFDFMKAVNFIADFFESSSFQYDYSERQAPAIGKYIKDRDFVYGKRYDLADKYEDPCASD